MRGLTLHSSTDTNQLQLTIPNELKGVPLQIIILPAGQSNEEIEFFSEDELAKLSYINSGTPLKDDEDYSKW